MKVLIINTMELEGGAARAANRLHKGLLENGINSQMLVMKKSTDQGSIVSPFSIIEQEYNKLLPTISVLPLLKYNKNRKKVLFSPQFMAKNLSKIIKDINPDIVHLHWFNAGFMNLETLLKIDKPIVWSLHDMWAFTGGCHYTDGCEKYLSKCNSCHILGSNKNIDLSTNLFNKKENVFSKKFNFTIIGLSKWITDCARKSQLLKSKNIINLPNPINIKIFKKFDKDKSRELWNLPKNKKLILFGAMNATSDKRKGFKELLGALNLLKNKNIELIVFGSTGSSAFDKLHFPIHYLGNLSDDVSLRTIYSAVDVMVVPSLQENLSNAIVESLSCSTPVVGFNIGGNSDMIIHKENGYLAEPYNVKDLAIGIEWVLENDNYNNICDNARKKVLKDFDSKKVVLDYLDVYRSILK